MNIIVIIAIVLAMGAVLYALIRGIVAFLRTIEADLKGEGTSEMHLMQNKMMFARVKYQAIAVILLVILGMFAAAK
ncbi:hypothetical protein FSZ31_01900 [Sphingorhabdus soli]|uniref:HIG1 domain-containing protein n=1 Tax=Flavisphingopyxis soli TaxID=2601267 RepID=A0A5C6UKS6_9SPHN|nr:HIG1 domain-containing protein [Sphingorhabdus soli]TXC73527.1 hypothetical protein FSZ31_01900 [Sphingorhabdus soli]